MRLLLIFMALLIGLSLQSQTFTEKSGISFDVDSGILTGNVIEVSGLSFDLFQTTSGSSYVKAISAKGNIYPVWIGTKTEMKYNDQFVYVTKSGKYCYYKLSKTGYPYAVWLNKE